MILSRPQPYTRGMRPSLGGDVQFLMNELQKVETTLRDLCDFVPQETDVPPARPRVGMHRYARAPWRPLGGSVDRWVFWDGTAWLAL